MQTPHDVQALHPVSDRACGPHNAAAAVGSTAQLTLALFDEIECGLIVCEGQGRILLTNQAASAELTDGRLLTRQGEQLRPALGTSGEFEAALVQAAQRSRRRLVRLSDGRGDELLASVLPFHAAGSDQHLVLVVLGRRQPCSDLGLEMLAGSYGLTLAERRVLGGLVRQATPREIASAHAVKLSTVRTQISSIRAKFGARSIEGLLLRAAQVPPVASALRMAGGQAAMPWVLGKPALQAA